MSKKNFWEKLKRPFYALAPMSGVTDSAFRQICKEFGADVVYSELASATALAFAPQKTLEMIGFSPEEKPYVVQLFGADPRHFAAAAALITKKVKPDGIDINFGCPARKVRKQGAGSALMADLNLSKKAVKAVLENTDLPVSVKCRTSVEAGGGKQVTVMDFLKKISGLGVKAVMIHGRPMSRGHSGPVDWENIREARNYFEGVLIANGGVRDLESARELLKKTGADGIGIGQGALGRPWIFRQVSISNYQLAIKDIFRVALKHATLAHKLKGKQGVIEMRKHLCWYVSGFPNASELRRKLVKVESLNEIKIILKIPE